MCPVSQGGTWAYPDPDPAPPWPRPIHTASQIPTPHLGQREQNGDNVQDHNGGQSDAYAANHLPLLHPLRPFAQPANGCQSVYLRYCLGRVPVLRWVHSWCCHCLRIVLGIINQSTLPSHSGLCPAPALKQAKEGTQKKGGLNHAIKASKRVQTSLTMLRLSSQSVTDHSWQKLFSTILGPEIGHLCS